MSKAPNLKQLAVLDWLRRWQGVLLNEKGRFTATWQNDESRLHMMGVVSGLGGPTEPGESGREGWGTFDGTPHCGGPTFRVLLTAEWLESVENAYRGPCYQLSRLGLATLHRFCFQLKGYQPRKACDRVSRPIRASAALLKRYGGPDGARSYLQFHERQAAYHTKIADRVRESLELYEGSAEQRRDAWMARKATGGRR